MYTTIYKHDKEVFSSDSLQVMVDLQKHFKTWDEAKATCLNLSSAIVQLKRLEGFQVCPQMAEDLAELESFVATEYDSIAKSDNPRDLGEFMYTVQFEEEW